VTAQTPPLISMLLLVPNQKLNIGKIKDKDSTPEPQFFSRSKMYLMKLAIFSLALPFSYVPWISWTEINGMTSKIHVI
jgi:hypothetical protein